MDKVRAVKEALTERYREREAPIEGLVLSLVARQHMLLIGPPGTAKSAMVLDFAKMLGLASFSWLLTKFTTPAELFGPVSLTALEEGRYGRVTAGKLPEAEVAFLDEIFKASSAILNTLLTLMQERIFYNNGGAQTVPLISIIGASNEMPSGEELAAFYDRFLARFVVSYVSDEQIPNLLAGSQPPVMVMGRDELIALQEQAQQVSVPDSVIDRVVEIRAKLRKEGIIPSDRRFVQSLDLAKASAAVDGRDEIMDVDLRPLEWTLWNLPEHRQQVVRVVNMVIDPLAQKALEITDEAESVFKNAIDLATAEAGVEAVNKLKVLIQRCKEEIAKAGDQNPRALEKAREQLEQWNAKVVEVCLGLGKEKDDARGRGDEG